MSRKSSRSIEEFSERTRKFFTTLNKRELALFPKVLDKMYYGEPVSTAREYDLMRRFETQVLRSRRRTCC
jgi:hypothetical protein